MSKEIKRLQAKVATSRSLGAIEDRSIWDWFADGCPCGLLPGECTTHHRARASQRPPTGDWITWLLLAGRGTGKTRSAAELVRHWAETDPMAPIGLIGPTYADLRDVMVRAVLATAPPWFRPTWQPSKRLLSWPNGARAICLSADQPDRVRGFNFGRCWTDELCSWQNPAETWDLLAMANRIGDVRTVVTTTPRPSKLLARIMEAPTTRISRETTFDNARHLSPAFIEHAKATYGSSRLARQELYGEIVEAADHVVYPCFDPERNLADQAAYHPGFPVIVAVDCGTSELTAAVVFQERPIGGRKGISVFGEFVYDHKKERAYAEAAAVALRAYVGSLPCHGRIDRMVLDPYGAPQGSGLGQAARECYANIFGSRVIDSWPGHRVLDGVDQANLMLDQGLLTITPSCTKLKAALLNHSWTKRRGEPTNIPSDEHPHADLCDALRGAVRDRFPDGVKLAPSSLRQTDARRLF